MVQSFVSKWIEGKRRKDRMGKVCRVRRATFRPRLEALEDRTLMNAGALDPTFGNGGVVVNNTNSNQWALGVQPDGKLLEAGSGFGIELLRTNTDGTLDQTFRGSNGQPYAIGGFFAAASVIAQPDGKILVAGRHDLGGEFQLENFFVARFNSDGTLDNSFGVGGMADAQIGHAEFGQSNYVAGMVLQADGKIVLAGTANGQIALVRYNADGALDATFGDAGTVVTPHVGGGGSARAIALQPDGKIVVAGTFGDAPVNSENFGAVRYNIDGSLDSTFGAGGIVETAFVGQYSAATDVAIQANGDVVVVGSADADGQHFYPALLRYTPDGHLDTTFGNGGQVVTNTRMDLFASVRLALQADGKILLGTSSANVVGGTGDKEVLARYDNDGCIDASFGDGGQTVTNFGQNFVLLTGLALEPDGSIVTAGFSYTAPANNPDNFSNGPLLTLARFQNDSLPLVLPKPPPAPTNGPSTPTSAPTTSTPPAVIAPSTPPPAVPNSLVFTQGSASQEQSAVIPQSSILLVAPPPAATPPVVSGPSTADPFGIHLVGGSGPGDVDTTAKWDEFPVFAPDYPIGDAATGLAALPLTPADEAGVSMAVVMDALFLQMPLWTRLESAAVGAVELNAAPLADFPATANPAPSLVKSEGVGRWPTLAVGVLLSTGLTAATVEERRRRLPYSTTTE
jgi:uncharacterized delta-60 repeat protein